MTRYGTAAAVAAGLGLCAFSASAGVIAEYALSDHPDGNAAPPTYGLRMDGMFGNGGVASFSFDVFNDVRLVVSENAGVLNIDITGTVFGGEVSGNAYVDPAAYSIDFNYTMNVEAVADGWRVVGVDNVANTGTLTRLDDAGDAMNVVTMTDDDNNAFLFLADGHRLPGDNESFVGRGWLTSNANGNGDGGVQDFLFRGTLIPAPGGMVLGIAGLGMVASTRRRG